VEEQRTNLLQRSEEFDNAYWTKTNATVTANTVVAPDGTLNGDQLVEDTDTSVHQVGVSSNVGSAGAHTFSIYAKSAGRSFAVLRLESVSTYFNLSNGTVGTTGAGHTAQITNVGNGWYRCSVTKTLSAATSSCAVRSATANGTDSYTGDGYSGIYIWGAQLE
jgi:hypothetical protein